MSNSANRERINNVLANLYISDEDTKAETTGDAIMEDPPKYEEHHGPSPSEIDNVWNLLYNSLKLTAVDYCPIKEHQHLSYFSCPAALGRQTGYKLYITKRDSFIRNWDHIITLPDNGAFDFDGKDVSYHAFVAKNGFGPAQFAQQFAERSSYMFGPSGKMEDLVRALMDFWVMRTSMWKAKYSSGDEVRKKWMPEAYDLSDTKTMSLAGVADLYDVQMGAMIHTCEVTMGPKGHQSEVTLLPLTKLKKCFAVKIVEGHMCHKDCPVARGYWDYHLKNSTKGLARTYGHGEVDVSNIRGGTAAQMRAHYGLPPDPHATDITDVLWLV